MNHPRKHGGVLTRTSPDGTFLFHTGTNELFRVNRTGGRIWELLDGDHSAERLVEIIVREFKGADASRVDAAVRQFLSRLNERRLLAGSSTT